MAEFCVECWHKLTGMGDEKWRYVITSYKDLCEGCGQYKQVIVTERYISRIQRYFAEKAEKKENKIGRAHV